MTTAIPPTSDATGSHAARRPNGQVLVIFAGAMLVMTLMMAVVIDLSWLWSSTLRVQRAADAAALAGAVTLPDDPNLGKQLALKEAFKNGYDDSDANVVVDANWDGQVNPYRMNVTITAPVGMFFMRVVGLNSFDVSRTGRAEYNLPLKMGSFDNYYGVGFFEGNVAGASVATGPRAAGSADLSGPNRDFVTANQAFSSNDAYATGVVGTAASGDSQAYGAFGFNIDDTDRINGIEVHLEANASDPAGCELAVELSNTNGLSWSTTGKNIDLTDLDPPGPPSSWPALGGSGDLWGLTWAPVDLDNGQLKVRLRALDPEGADDATNTDPNGCNNTAVVSVDEFEVTVFHSPRVKTRLPVPNPVSGQPDVVPRDVWGAIITAGGFRENGDRYAPAFLGGGAGGSPGSANPNYDADGYDYTVQLSGGATNGTVWLFDPMFCATGDNGHGGSFGAGDHWTDHPGGQVIAPVAVTYTLFDMNGTPINTADDTQIGAPVTYDPGTSTMGDFSGDFGVPQNSTYANRVDCSGNPAHNRWVQFATGLTEGTYRVNVNTSAAPGNLNVGGENMFSIYANASGGKVRVYGSGRMAAYANVDDGISQFYLTQIEAIHKGKTIEVKLFDPGETNGDAFLKILSPDGDAYNYVPFSWKSDDGRSGTSVVELQTSNGGALFNNRLVTITIPLPTDYGSRGLTPSTESEPGWWKIEYRMDDANDTTTWEVSIVENPVHLVVE
jgi:Flp pilus assembly protein TadG